MNLVINVHNKSYAIGEPTGFYHHSTELYTGDEVELHNGKKGVILNFNGDFVIVTNKEISKLSSIKQVTPLARRNYAYNHPNELKIVRRHSDLRLGVEVAVGRKTNTGFKVV